MTLRKTRAVKNNTNTRTSTTDR